MICTLCKSPVDQFHILKDRSYFRCMGCQSILLNPKDFLSSQKEKERYEKHNNDVHDSRYQKFVSPIVESVLKRYTKTDRGLDFGAGTGPVITKMLKEHEYQIEIYDPFLLITRPYWKSAMTTLFVVR